MRARSDDAHVSAQDVPKLRNLVDAQFAKPFSDRINARVIVAGLTGELGMIGPHRSKFINYKLSVLHAGPDLLVKKRAGRLQSLCDPDHDGQQRKNEEYDWQRNEEVDRTLEKTV